MNIRILSPVLFILILFSSALCAQVNLFSKVLYDQDQALQSYSIAKASSNGFLVAGDFGYGGIAIRIDTNGNVLWARKLDGISYMAKIRGCISTPDSCFVLAGMVYAGPNLRPVLLLIKMRESGLIVWSSATDYTDWVTVNQIILTNDQGFLVTGFTSPASGERAFAAKFSSTGARNWSYYYTVPGNSGYLNAASQLSDNSFILNGTAYDQNLHRYKQTILKLSSDGTVEWSKIANQDSNESFRSFDVLTESDGFLFYGGGYNGGVVLTKTNLEGEVLWSKEYPYYFSAYEAVKIKKDLNGGYIAINNNWTGELLRFSNTGDLLWVQELFLNPTDVLQTNSGYLVCGNGPIYGVSMAPTPNPQIGILSCDTLGNSISCTNQGFTSTMVFEVVLSDIEVTRSTAGVSFNYNLVTQALNLMNEDGCVAFIGGTQNNDLQQSAMFLYPNPSDQICYVSLPSHERGSSDTFEVYNSAGRLVFSTTDLSKLTAGFSTLSFSDGIYLCRMVHSGNDFTAKLIVSHH